MSVQINIWGVLLATAASMVVGFVYYSPKVFGNAWMEAAKVKPEAMQKGMAKKMPWVVLASLITAEVLAYMTFLYHAYFANSWLAAGVVTSLLLWLGISATTVWIHNSFEGKSNHLTYLTLGNRLLTLLAMGLVIGWIHP